MDTTTITTMGILSDIVYNNKAGKNFFERGYEFSVNNSTYTVVDYADRSTDMQALLLKNGNDYVIAFRGTESAMDWVTNLSAGLYNYNPQFIDALMFVQEMMANNHISASNLTLTGHSLGGILTQAVGATLKIKGYAYNPWGASTLSTSGPTDIKALLLQYLQRAISGANVPAPDINFAQENILNISYQDNGTINGDILSNTLTGLISKHLGRFLPIIGENQNGYYGHLMETLNPAIAHYNAVLTHFTSNTTYDDLSAAYLSVNDYQKTEKIFADAGVYNQSITGLSSNFLNNDSASQIVTQAKSDSAVLYALANLNPFAIEGNLPAYANLNRTDMSAKYLEDRAQYLYYLLDKTNRYDVDPSLSMTHYEDAYTLEQTFSSPLVLDLNHDGITSTFISETSTYFDLDSEKVNGVNRETILGCGIINKTKYQQKVA